MKILIADPHPIMSIGISSVLEQLNVGLSFTPFANDTAELKKLIKREQPKIVIVDLDLADFSGLQTIKEIKELNRTMRVFVWSRQPEEIYALSTIKSGASAYLCKVCSQKEFTQAFIRVMRGGIYLSDTLTKELNERNYKKSHYNNFKKLSTREVEVLDLLSKGTRNKEIANRLEINEKTVSTYKTRLLKKLKADNIADLIHQSNFLQGTDVNEDQYL